MMSEVRGGTQQRAGSRGSAGWAAPHHSPGTTSNASAAGMACLACYDYLATRPSGLPQYQEGLKAAAAARETPQHSLNCEMGERGRAVCPPKGGRCLASH